MHFPKFFPNSSQLGLRLNTSEYPLELLGDKRSQVVLGSCLAGIRRRSWLLNPAARPALKSAFWTWAVDSEGF